MFDNNDGRRTLYENLDMLFLRIFLIVLITVSKIDLGISQDLSVPVYAQLPEDSKEKMEKEFPKFRAKELILPSAALGYGFLALKSDALIDFNQNVFEKIGGDSELGADDILLFVPVATAYGLDLFTHQAKHSLKDRTLILLTATAINNGATFGLKALTNERRPLEDKYNAFPSGHTSNAFMGAEFLRQEFKDASPWYGVLGYGMGTTVAYMRLYNNKHWFSDVVAGAGLGVLSTKTAYWIYPWMASLFNNDENAVNLSLYPSYEEGAPQIGFLVNF